MASIVYRKWMECNCRFDRHFIVNFRCITANQIYTKYFIQSKFYQLHMYDAGCMSLYSVELKGKSYSHSGNHMLTASPFVVHANWEFSKFFFYPAMVHFIRNGIWSQKFLITWYIEKVIDHTQCYSHFRKTPNNPNDSEEYSIVLTICNWRSRTKTKKDIEIS